MEDQGIIALFFDRSEQAIVKTDKKYGRYCYSIAYNILSNREDSEESVSDTYLEAWNTIPPRHPGFLNAFLAKITRHISIDRWRKRSAKKRGGGEIILALEELEDCVVAHGIETEFSKKELTRVLNQFLLSLPETERNVFLCRYWYLDSIQTISEVTGFTQSKVTSMLHRTRGKLRKKLSEEEAMAARDSYKRMDLDWSRFLNSPSNSFSRPYIQNGHSEPLCSECPL